MNKNYPLTTFLIITLLCGCITTNVENSPAVRDLYLERLSSLGYLTSSEEVVNGSKLSGVVFYDTNLSAGGLNVYSSCKTNSIRVIDMNGSVLKEVYVGNMSSNYIIFKPYPPWGFVVIPYASNSNQLRTGIYGDLKLVFFNSSVGWVTNGSYHHDISLSDDGIIYSLQMVDGELSSTQNNLPIRDDVITILSSDGSVTKTIALSDVLGDNIPPSRLEDIQKASAGLGNVSALQLETLKDVFHTNTVEVLNKDIAVGDKGDLLLCLRTLDLIGILNSDSLKLVWSWGPGELDGPHAPTILSNGNILVFDNGYSRNYSRVIEVNPSTREIVWEYRGNPPESFHSRTEGSAQKLPNGNVLIAESNKGHAFEVTLDGRVVWDFWNPDIDNVTGKRRLFNRFLRYDSQSLNL